jgi:hypothetical protein
MARPLSRFGIVEPKAGYRAGGFLLDDQGAWTQAAVGGVSDMTLPPTERLLAARQHLAGCRLVVRSLASATLHEDLPRGTV